jgi:hypothetical protein
MDIGKSFDRYVIQARIIPVLLVVFPIASLIVVWLPEERVGWKLLSGLISLVLLSLVAQVGRDAGKRSEPELFQKWGGKPSIRKLRQRDSDMPWVTLERLRERLVREVGISCPTKAEEETDPASADEVYAAYVDHLREATRADTILLSENIGYGFRRNLWGMRPAGTVLAAVGTLSAAIGTVLVWGSEEMILPAVATFINAGLLAFWTLRVNEDWVKDAAESYADRLFRAYLRNPESKADSAA